MSDDLKHYGVKGMRWGVRKDRSSSEKKSNETLKKAGAIAAASLAISAATAISIAQRNTRRNREAERLIQEALATPFKWRDQAGDWHKYAKEGGLWVLEHK